jgi:hypothetical protein
VLKTTLSYWRNSRSTSSHIVDVHTGVSYAMLHAGQPATDSVQQTKVGCQHKKALNKLVIVLDMQGPGTLSSGEYSAEIKAINHPDLPPYRRKVCTYTTTHTLVAKPNYMPITDALEPLHRRRRLLSSACTGSSQQTLHIHASLAWQHKPVVLRR